MKRYPCLAKRSLDPLNYSFKQELRERAAKAPPITEWNSASPYRPLSIPALLGDAVEAFFRIGKPERPLDYMEKFIRLTGPHAILIFEDDPTLDGIENNPRFKKLRGTMPR